MHSQKRTYQTLDAIRGLAAIFIAFRHIPHFMNDVDIKGSFLAVDLFFCLSGFVLAASYEDRFRQGLSVGQFALMRVIRLYPLYILSSAMGVVVAVAGLFRPGGLEIDWTLNRLLMTIPLSTLMLPTPPLWQVNSLFPLNSVLWSIFYELIVNILYVAAFPFIRHNKYLLGVILVSAVALIYFALARNGAHGGHNWETLPLGCARTLFSFSLGILIYRKSKAASGAPTLFALVPLAAIVGVFMIADTVYIQLLSIMLLLPTIIVFGARVEPPGFIKWFGILGSSSYALYVLHKPLYQLALGAMIVLLPFPPETLAPWIGFAFIALLIPFTLAVEALYDLPVRRWMTSLLLPRKVAQA